MKIKTVINSLIALSLLAMIMPSPLEAQIDSSIHNPKFDSQLLKLKVPDAFQKSSLKLEVFADSSWQLYRGNTALSFADALNLLGEAEKLVEFEEHQNKEAILFKEYRSRRVFSIVSSLVGLTYLSMSWNKSWVYQIPGYAALMVASVRYLDSRRIEIQALREQYYLNSLISPTKIQLLVDNYNFRLYQYLSTAGIHFSDS